MKAGRSESQRLGGDVAGLFTVSQLRWPGGRVASRHHPTFATSPQPEAHDRVLERVAVVEQVHESGASAVDPHALQECSPLVPRVTVTVDAEQVERDQPDRDRRLPAAHAQTRVASMALRSTLRIAFAAGSSRGRIPADKSCCAATRAQRSAQMKLRSRLGRSEERERRQYPVDGGVTDVDGTDLPSGDIYEIDGSERGARRDPEHDRLR
jgi:hypothetical protein